MFGKPENMDPMGSRIFLISPTVIFPWSTKPTAQSNHWLRGCDSSLEEQFERSRTQGNIRLGKSSHNLGGNRLSLPISSGQSPGCSKAGDLQLQVLSPAKSPLPPGQTRRLAFQPIRGFERPVTKHHSYAPPGPDRPWLQHISASMRKQQH